MDDKVRKLKEIVDNTDNLVFFGGAGVSTESGIPDFRSTDGLYNMKYKYPPETIVSHTFFVRRTEEFFEFYKDKMMVLDAKPNKAHYKLAQWEKEGKCRAVVTQNIDGLHQMAGSKMFWNFTEVSTEIIVPNAVNFLTLLMSKTVRACRTVTPAADW